MWFTVFSIHTQKPMHPPIEWFTFGFVLQICKNPFPILHRHRRLWTQMCNHRFKMHLQIKVREAQAGCNNFCMRWLHRSFEMLQRFCFLLVFPFFLGWLKLQQESGLFHPLQSNLKSWHTNSLFPSTEPEPQEALKAAKFLVFWAQCSGELSS